MLLERPHSSHWLFELLVSVPIHPNIAEIIRNWVGVHLLQVSVILRIACCYVLEQARTTSNQRESRSSKLTSFLNHSSVAPTQLHDTSANLRWCNYILHHHVNPRHEIVRRLYNTLNIRCVRDARSEIMGEVKTARLLLCAACPSLTTAA